jgi:hypothetical protein
MSTYLVKKEVIHITHAYLWHNQIEETLQQQTYHTLETLQQQTYHTLETLQQQTYHTLETILQQNYFQHNNRFHKRTKGVAMGSPLSGLVA